MEGGRQCDSGQWHLLEADPEGRSGPSGKTLYSFEIWYWPCKRHHFPLSLLWKSPSVAELNYVKGYNEAIAYGLSATAQKNLRKLLSLLNTFHQENGHYPTRLSKLAPNASVDWCQPVDGYTFAYIGTRNEFIINADAIAQDMTGVTHYFADHSGRIWFSTYHKASRADIEDLPPK